MSYRRACKQRLTFNRKIILIFSVNEPFNFSSSYITPPNFSNLWGSMSPKSTIYIWSWKNLTIRVRIWPKKQRTNSILLTIFPPRFNFYCLRYRNRLTNTCTNYKFFISNTRNNFNQSNFRYNSNIRSSPWMTRRILKLIFLRQRNLNHTSMS